MNILVVIPSLATGGAERVASLLTHEWEKEHKVQIALFNAREQAFSAGGRVVDLHASARDSIWAKIFNPFIRVFRLSLLFRRERPDRIISFMESANLPSVLAAILSGMSDRLIVSVHHNPDHSPVFYRWLMPQFYRFAKQVVAVSAGVAESLCRMGICFERIKVIPNPVDISSWDTSWGNKALFNENWDRFSPFLLAVGRLHRLKGFDQLIEAFAQLQDNDLHLIILGEGAERKNLEMQIKRLGLETRVLLPGAVPNPLSAYRSARCFVMSSRHESWSMVLAEAMASGCPVVSFSCDFGPGEIIDHEVSGLLVDPGDVDGLSKAIRLVLEDENLRERLRQGGRRRVEDFRLEKIAPKWLEETC